MQLDYTIKTPQGRVEQVEKILRETPLVEQTPYLLERLANYILFIAEKKQTKIERETEHSITTKNREVTINKRQVSYEGMVETLDNGEDGLHALINNDKNQFLDRKEKITLEEIENTPVLKEQYDVILTLTNELENATGEQKFKLKKQIIEQWQQLYLTKASISISPQKRVKATSLIGNDITINEDISLDENKNLVISAQLTLLKEDHVSYMLCNYSKLKKETWEHLLNDVRWMLIELEDIITQLFPIGSPLYNLIVWKIDGLSNKEIQDRMRLDNIEHSEQYYSTLWRKKIPKMIAMQARKNWLIWYYSKNLPTEWKQCSKCGKRKPRHQLFFGKNSTADGFHSSCRDCRKKDGN